MPFGFYYPYIMSVVNVCMLYDVHRKISFIYPFPRSCDAFRNVIQFNNDSLDCVPYYPCPQGQKKNVCVCQGNVKNAQKLN